MALCAVAATPAFRPHFGTGLKISISPAQNSSRLVVHGIAAQSADESQPDAAEAGLTAVQPPTRSRPPLESDDSSVPRQPGRSRENEAGSPEGPPDSGRRGGRFGGQRERPFDRSDFPQWEIESPLTQDVFTFARIRYDGIGRTPDARWNNDYPDADLNFSWRLQQLTSMQVNPDGAVVRLDDPKLFEYPFVFMIGVTGINFSQAEASGLRHYLLNGGFLMVDDFWTPAEWRHISREMKKVFPDLEPHELTMDHQIFHIVYELKGVPRVPSIRAWQQGQNFEYWHGDPEGDEAPHFMAYSDSHGRLMALLCLNNDICDGWEREGENHEYFELFSEKFSYPLGINIVVYALTH